jgi:glutathione S-transferase
MKLYYAPGTCALAPHIVLEWIGADYQAVLADLGSDEYRKINPLGMVPALSDGTSRIMTQADAILKYLAAKFPDAQLGSEPGLMAEFDLDEALAFLTGDVHPAFWPFFAPQRYTTNGDEASIKAVREASFARIDRAMLHLDSMLQGHSHVCGNRRTIADAYAFAMVRWTENLQKTWKDYPSLKLFIARMYDDKGVVAAMTAQGLAVQS